MNETDLIFKAIAHPVRRQMIALLAHSELSVKELTASFEMSQPAVSQHLKELRVATLVTSERAGVEQRYRLTPRPLQYVVDWAERYRMLIDPAGHAWQLIGEDAGKRKKKGSRAHGR